MSTKLMKLIGAAVALAFVVGACSTGGGGDDAATGNNSGGQEDSASVGLADTLSPEEVVAATRGTYADKKVRMVVHTLGVDLSDNYTAAITTGFEQAGIDFVVKDANFDMDTMARDLENFISEKPDLLIVQNPDISALSSLILKAQDEGIYVIVLNLNSTAQSDAYVGPDWLDAGRMLAERIADDCVLVDKTKVALVLGSGADAMSVVAFGEVAKVLEDRGMEIALSQPGQFDPSIAEEVTSTALQQNPDLCAVATSWDGMVSGLANAINLADRKGEVNVYALDSSETSCDLIESGEVTAVLNYGVAHVGTIAVSVAQYLLQSGAEPGAARTAVFLPLRMIDSTNSEFGCYGADPI